MSCSLQSRGEIHLAITTGDVGRVKALLKSDPNLADQSGNTPLHLAAWESSREAIQILIEHGANVNATTSTGGVPIFSAVGQGSSDIVKMLLQAGAKVDVRDPHFGATPLHLSRRLRGQDQEPLARLRLL